MIRPTLLSARPRYSGSTKAAAAKCIWDQLPGPIHAPLMTPLGPCIGDCSPEVAQRTSISGDLAGNQQTLGADTTIAARTSSAIRSANTSMFLGRGGLGDDGRESRSITRRTVFGVVPLRAAAARKLPRSWYADGLSNWALADFTMGVPRGSD
jgi:hypothetical protein